MDCSLPGSFISEISQVRILEWFAISFSTILPDPGIKPTSLLSPVLAGGFFTTVPPGKALFNYIGKYFPTLYQLESLDCIL